jgi:ribosomal protein S18 acetylase RimI-like enzyme
MPKFEDTLGGAAEDIQTKLVTLSEAESEEILGIEEASMQTGTTYPLTPEVLKRLFAEGKYIIYGLRDERGALVAKVGLATVGDRFELDVCTRPDLQGKGLGKRVIEESLRDFLSRNPEASVFLKVHPENPALRLYERLGFVGEKVGEEYKTEPTAHGPRILMDYHSPDESKGKTT